MDTTIIKPVGSALCVIISTDGLRRYFEPGLEGDHICRCSIACHCLFLHNLHLQPLIEFAKRGAQGAAASTNGVVGGISLPSPRKKGQASHLTLHLTLTSTPSTPQTPQTPRQTPPPPPLMRPSSFHHHQPKCCSIEKIAIRECSRGSAWFSRSANIHSITALPPRCICAKSLSECPFGILRAPHSTTRSYDLHNGRISLTMSAKSGTPRSCLRSRTACLSHLSTNEKSKKILVLILVLARICRTRPRDPNSHLTLLSTDPVLHVLLLLGSAHRTFKLLDHGLTLLFHKQRAGNPASCGATLHKKLYAMCAASAAVNDASDHFAVVELARIGRARRFLRFRNPTHAVTRETRGHRISSSKGSSVITFDVITNTS